MVDSNSLITFNGLANSSNYNTFVLDEERGRLYVGAKDHIFSFNVANIKEFQKVFIPNSACLLCSAFSKYLETFLLMCYNYDHDKYAFFCTSWSQSQHVMCLCFVPLYR